MKRHKAFTLIELLVVVAIIALLISMLLPAMARSREITRKTVCLANLKQIGIALFSYGGNNNGIVPDGGLVSFHFDPKKGVIVDTPNSTRNWQAGWPEQLFADGDVLQKYGTRGGSESYSSGWAQAKGIFYCKSAGYNNPVGTASEPVGNKVEGSNSGQAGYGMGYYAASKMYKRWSQNVTPPIPPEGYAGPNGFAQPYIMKTHMWRAQGIVVVESDTGFFGAIGAGGASSTGRYGVYSIRHMKGANYLLGDGHAEWSDKWNQDDQPGVPSVPRTFTKNPESNWNDVNRGQPKDISVWGHNPNGKNGNGNR